jgi:hypothetical protein
MSFPAYLKYAFALLLLLTVVTGARADDEAAATGAATPPDEILLKNGSRILGKVTDIRDGIVSIETDFAGELSVTLEQIVSMSTAEEATLLLADETVIEQPGIQVEDSELVLEAGAAAATTYPIDDLLVINPEPWELGNGYKWTGIASFAFSIERGNSKIDELDYKLDTVWRSKRDRFTLKLDGEVDEANDQKNADNWLILGKYDYYISDRSYWGVNASAESDEFKDLDLRYLIGPYFGHDFYTDPLFTLSAEVGVSYVNEDFITAEDQDYPAGNWFLRMTSDYLGGDSQLYFEQRGIWNLDETSDVVIDTSVGLAFPLLWQLEAAAEVLWEYDSGAVEGVEELDETYRLRIGYSW